MYFTLIQSFETTGSPVVFSSIPSSYDDLLVRVDARDNGQVWGWYSFNGSNSVYQITINGQGNGTNPSGGGPGADHTYTMWYTWDSSQANVYAPNELYIADYNGNHYKNIYATSIINDNGSYVINYQAALEFTSNTAINSISFTPHAGSTFQSGSKFSLYGISKS